MTEAQFQRELTRILQEHARNLAKAVPITRKVRVKAHWRTIRNTRDR